MKKIRWGVIGSTGIALRRTIPEGILSAKNAELAAVYSRNKKNNAEVGKKFGARAANSLEDLLRDDVDAVYIATPNNVHLEQVRKAAAAGKHIFCEKPLGMNVAEAREMLAICKKAKVNLGTAFMMRYHSQHQATLRMVRHGKIGQPVFARAQIAFWYPPIPGAWRQIPKLGGGGALIDLAGHCLDLLEMFFGPVTSVSCMTNCTIHNYKADDSGVVLAQFKNGATATVDTFFCVANVGSKNRLELYGTKGSILAENTLGQGQAGEMRIFTADAPQGKVIAPKPVNTYRAEIEDFSQAILDNRNTSESALRGLRSQVLLEACYKSARTGRQISL
jgi:1,5-anhydro-D-fructose reductase (1,5-anhydro-D-mannitol-forming)